MTKKQFLWILLTVLVSFLAQLSLARAEEAKNSVTQEELAKTLAERMDLDVAKEAPANEYFKTLEERGIKPTKGWDQRKPVTKQDLGDVLIDAGRLQVEVLSGKNTEEVLKERGIIIPNEINRKTVEDVFKDQNVNRLLETPAVSGPSVPFPQEEVKVTEPVLSPLPVPEFVISPIEETLEPIVETPKLPPTPPEPPKPLDEPYIPKPPTPPEPPKPSEGGS